MIAPSRQFFLRFFLCLLFFGSVPFSLCGCHRTASGPFPNPAASLPRPDPSYIAWLEHQSMLANAPKLALKVSGTSRAFGHSDEPQRARVLLRAAPSWIWLNPIDIGGAQPLARQIVSKNLVHRLKELGISGMFMAPLAESGAIWAAQNGAQSGWDGISLGFSGSVGSYDETAKIYELAEENDIQTGGELPPAATGIGPDFMLQARRAARHDGLYAMISVPKKDWPLLPAISREWTGAPLSANSFSALAADGLLPQAFARDRAGLEGGWAATGEIAGTDGQIRRWIYRYAQNPERPVILWQDPSGAAKSIFSAAIIQQTGLLGQTLTGLRVEPLIGFENGDSENNEPALEAVGTLSREIHRYGGWAIQNDPVSLKVIDALLNGPLDFCAETESGTASDKAMMTGDTARLYAVLGRLKNLPLERTARGVMQDEKNAFMPEQIFAQLQKNSPRPGADEFANACLLAIAFRIGLPGLALFSPAELGLDVFCKPGVIPPGHTEKLFVGSSALLLTRAKNDLALGKLKSVHGGDSGWIATITSLPSGNLWMLAANYSPKKMKVSFGLPFSPAAAQDARTGEEIFCFNGANAELVLDGQAARHVIFYERQRN